VGETTVSESYLELHLPADGSYIGSTIYSGELEPGESAFVLNPIEWAPAPSRVGWHNYHGRSVTLKAEPGIYDNSYWANVYVPQLPTYELDLRPSDLYTKSRGSGTSVTEVSIMGTDITNTGDLPGDATAHFNLLQSTAGESTGEKDQTPVSIGPGETYEIFRYGSGEKELYYNPQQKGDDSIKVEVTVEDDRKVHDSATASTSWRTPPSGDPGEPCESGEPQLEVETSPSETIIGNRVSYDVYLVECEDEEEGTLKKRELSPSEYSVAYDPGSIGPREYLTLYRGSEQARGKIPRQTSKDEIRFAWRVEHDGSGAWGIGAAIWVKR
jgi:hypothetical protein